MKSRAFLVIDLAKGRGGAGASNIFVAQTQRVMINQEIHLSFKCFHLRLRCLYEPFQLLEYQWREGRFDHTTL